jgi:DNA-binding winged helix-turn-helix (wHTH) protein/TolB-like protein
MSDTVQFGPFTFDVESGALAKHGSTVRLQPQPSRVLAALVRRAGDVVSREELRQQLWPSGTYVDFERGLNFAVGHIRSALGDSADRPLYIETLPKRGYRFIAPITRPSDAGTRPPEVAPPITELPSAPTRKWLRARTAAVVVVALMTLAALAFIWAEYRTRPIRVAVVSFDNETGQDGLDEVAVAIADMTVARLAAPDRLGRLSVVGNAAALRRPRDFRDVKEIGRAVDVSYVVLAQMKIDPSKVRLIAHLIRVSDEAHVWANSYDRDAFTLDAQSEIAEAIASAVSNQLTGS